MGVALAATVVATPTANAAVSPDEQWLTSVPGFSNVESTMAFGSTGATAVLTAVTNRCGSTTNVASNALLVSRLAQNYYSPQVPTGAVGVAECLNGSSVASRTVTFNEPIVGPIFHINNLDASMLDFDAPVTLETIKKNFPLQLQESGTRLRNSVNAGTNNCTDDESAVNNPGCGSFRLSQDGGAVSEFTFTNTSLAGNDGWFWSLSFHVAELTKEFSPATIVEGATSELSLVITNPATEGAVDLDNVDYTDELPAGVSLADGSATTSSCGPAVVNGGAPAAGDTTVSVTGASIAAGDECVVTVNVTASSAGSYVNDSSNLTTSLGNVVPSANATLDVVAPALELTKSGVITTDSNSNGLADIGDQITYSFLVENTGDSPLDDVVINDPRVASATPASQSIPVGESRTFEATYDVVQSDIDAGVVSNTATASGIYGGPDGDVTISSASNTADVPTPDRVPGLTIVKSGVLDDSNGNGTADAGERIDYAFTVSNTGNVTLTDVEVIDDRVSGLSPASVTLNASGGEQLFTSESYIVTQADVEAGEILNVASARAMTPMGTTVSSVQDTVRFETTPVAAPSPDPSASPEASPTPAPGGTPADPSAPVDATESDELSATGAEVLLPAGIATGLLVLGLTVLARSRRRFTAAA